MTVFIDARPSIYRQEFLRYIQSFAPKCAHNLPFRPPNYLQHPLGNDNRFRLALKRHNSFSNSEVRDNLEAESLARSRGDGALDIFRAEQAVFVGDAAGVKRAGINSVSTVTEINVVDSGVADGIGVS